MDIIFKITGEIDRTKKDIIELTRIGIAEYRKSLKLPFRILTDNVRSMHNIGAIFRTADAFLAEEVILAGISGCPPHPEISKSALGAEESVKWRHVTSAVDEVMRQKQEGRRVISLEQAHGSIDLNELQIHPEEEILLVVGNEVSGVDQRIVDLSDTVVEIEQCGTKHSLNVSVSAGIAMWKIFTLLH